MTCEVFLEYLLAWRKSHMNNVTLTYWVISACRLAIHPAWHTVSSEYYNERDYVKCGYLNFCYILNDFYERLERFLLVQGGPVDKKWTYAGPSGEELTVHIKHDGYINRIINVIAVPIMNGDGSVDKVTVGNGWLWFAPHNRRDISLPI